eukprot:TRINITY_DN4113_c0_g1_i1.p1 TRINITY_DN4113_c0_g1~~TRINITY_DN4113_c0_g1_i1.p1  ORF type:complete len:207 (-),score=60.33 TRINITY_DN4113_c0_g1_i1:5-625(-)
MASKRLASNPFLALEQKKREEEEAKIRYFEERLKRRNEGLPVDDIPEPTKVTPEVVFSSVVQSVEVSEETFPSDNVVVSSTKITSITLTSVSVEQIDEPKPDFSAPVVLKVRVGEQEQKLDHDDSSAAEITRSAVVVEKIEETSYDSSSVSISSSTVSVESQSSSIPEPSVSSTETKSPMKRQGSMIKASSWQERIAKEEAPRTLR